MNPFYKNLILLLLISTPLSACGNAVAAAPPIRFEPCLPDNNSYTDQIHPSLNNIYSNGVASVNDPGRFNSFQQQAFNDLVNRVYDWTDLAIIKTGMENIEIAITYLSPELAQSIVINHFLYKRNNDFTGRLDDQVKNQIVGIINRNEHVFFITFIAPPSNNDIKIEFPLNKLELTNTSNLTINREHDDHNLEIPIVLQNDLEYGFFYFPMAVIKDGSCQTVLDKKRDTSIVISIPSIKINGTDLGPQSWRFEYAPLINMTSLSTDRKSKFITAQPVDQISPAMGMLSPGGKEDQKFWISLARIIWLETTLDP